MSYKDEQRKTREALKPRLVKPGVSYNRAARREKLPSDPKHTKKQVVRK